MEKTPAIEFRGVTKRFGTIVANDRVSMKIASGEILALLGENGSGKTTLMNMLSGIYYPDSGEILVNGEPVSIRSPKDAYALGIGMIHQHFKLIDVFNATDNVILGLRGGMRLDRRKAVASIREISEKYGFDVDPDQNVFEMSVSQKQTLEIVEVEINDGATTLSVFNMPENDRNQYFLSLGMVGIGDDFIQLNLDPVSQLFIPLGDTLEEAQAKLEEFRALAKQADGTSLETTGYLAIGNPTTADPEPVYLNARRLLFSRNVEFSVQREGYIRATYVANSELGSLLSGVKFYRKLHPNEP